MDIKWNGCWEAREGRVICRWMVTWIESNKSKIGCIAGYSGGGSFQLERFYINNRHIMLECDEEYDELVSEQLKCLAEDCQDYVLEIHDQDMWFENDNLIMKSEKVGEFKKSDDLYVGSNSDLKELKLLFEKVGLTAINKV